ncbi:hypothetical protein J7K50_00580 [bacterium]|nr:hypothetical protein [bacterium]
MIYSCKLRQYLLFKIWLWAIIAVLAGIVVALIFSNIVAVWIGLGIGLVILLVFLNLIILPPRLEVHEDVVKLKEFRFFGLSVGEQSVSYDKIALVKKDEGIFFSSIVIETSGGDRDLFFSELRRGNARKAYKIIEEKRGKSS